MEGAEIGPVNIGNPVENTIREIADIIIAKVCARVCVRAASRATLWILIRVCVWLQVPESTSQIVFRPLPSDDPERRLPDITLARTKLVRQPQSPSRSPQEQTRLISHINARLCLCVQPELVAQDRVERRPRRDDRVLSRASSNRGA